METDGGGWTVFQRRQDGSVDFYRNWTDYENGFGNLTGEFWLGLGKINRLTKEQSNTLRVDLGDFDGNTRYAQYTTFSVGNSTIKYKLTVIGYSGTAGDSLTGQHNGMKFSTRDNDNDNWGGGGRGGVTVASIMLVPGGLITASVHISMVPIIIIQSLVQVMALFGLIGKVIIIPSSSQR